MNKLFRCPWFLPTAIFTILVLVAANMHPLWGDEAETALFARNTLKYSIPKGWDGTNIMGINNAVVLNQNLINHTSPWAQYYLTAFSFAIFGQSSFTARLPSIIFSIISLPLLYFLVIKLTNNKKIAFLTLIVLSLSVPFILFSYQARYYSLSTFASLLLVYFCLFLMEKSLWPKIGFIVSGILFFYANYVSFVAFYATTFFAFLFYFLCKKEFFNLKKFIFRYLGLGIIIVFFTAPWYLLLKPFENQGIINLPNLYESLQILPFVIQTAVSPYNENGAFPLLFIPLLILTLFLIIRKKMPVSSFLLPLLLPSFYLSAMIIFTLIAVVDTTFIHTRYTMIILPFLSILVAQTIWEIWRFKKLLGLVVLILFLATNFFTLNKPRSLLWEFVNEAINSYPTPDKAVADYLKEHAKDGETAFVSLDRAHEPLIFHLGDKIRFVNRVSLVNTNIFPKNRSVIPRYIYDFRDDPDWIVLFSKRENDGSFLVFDKRALWPEVNLETDYEEIILPIFFSDMSRPELELRSFEKINPDPNDQIFIYKKKPKNE